MLGVQGVGFSIWRALGPTEWDQFKPLIENQGIAVYSGGAVSGPTVVTASQIDLGSPRLTDGVRVTASQPFTVELDPNDCAFDDAVTVGVTYAPRLTRCVRVRATTVTKLEVHRNVARED